jgi:hypothetical protein
VQRGLLEHDCGPALAWCSDHSSKLRKLNSCIEFQVRRPPNPEVLEEAIPPPPCAILCKQRTSLIIPDGRPQWIKREVGGPVAVFDKLVGDAGVSSVCARVVFSCTSSSSWSWLGPASA